MKERKIVMLFKNIILFFSLNTKYTRFKEQLKTLQLANIYRIKFSFQIFEQLIALLLPK